MAIIVNCKTISALLQLIEKCITGQMTEIFRPVEEELRVISQNDELNVVVFMQDLDIVYALEKVGKKI